MKRKILTSSRLRINFTFPWSVSGWKTPWIRQIWLVVKPLFSIGFGLKSDRLFGNTILIIAWPKIAYRIVFLVIQLTPASSMSGGLRMNVTFHSFWAPVWLIGFEESTYTKVGFYLPVAYCLAFGSEPCFSALMCKIHFPISIKTAWFSYLVNFINAPPFRHFDTSNCFEKTTIVISPEYQSR